MGNDSITGAEYEIISLHDVGDITINLNDTVTTGSTMYATDNMFWHSNPIGATGSSGGVGTISTITLTDTINTNHSIDWSSTFFHEPKEFVDCMPSMTTVKEMCETYPGFKKAFDHFKDVYDLVKGDYEARKNSDE